MARQCIILICLFFPIVIFSQSNFKNDIHLLCNPKHSFQSDSVNNKKVMHIDKHNKLNYINPFYGMLKGSMFVYQRVISPQLNADCVFEQSCSNFSKSAIRRYGIIKGVLLSGDRLTRCVPGTHAETEAIFKSDNGRIIDRAEFYSLKHK